MKNGWAILWMCGLLLAGVATARASETDESEPLATAKLTVEQANRLLTTARAATEDGLYRLAHRRLEELVASAPDKRRQAEAALWLARVQLASGQLQEALFTLEKHGGQVRSLALLAPYSLTRAQVYFSLNQLPLAAAELADFRDKFAEQECTPAAFQLWAKICAAQENWAEALEMISLLETRFAQSPSTATASLDLAMQLGRAGRESDALNLLRGIETNQVGTIWSERAMLKAMEIQFAQGRNPQWVERLKKVASDSTMSAETRANAYRFLAEALGEESDKSVALSMIDRSMAVAATPAQRLESQVVKAKLLLRSGALDSGRECWRTAAAQWPDEIQAARLQRALADHLAQAQHNAEAAEEYQVWLDAFSDTPEVAQVLVAQGWALWSSGRTEEAASAYTRALQLERDPARQFDVLQKLGDAQVANKRYALAKEAYTSAHAFAPTGSETAARIQYLWAEVELHLGEIEAGEIRLLDLSRSEFVSLFSRMATMRLGALYDERGAFESAMEQYGRIIGTCSMASNASTDVVTCAEATLARGLIRYRTGAFAAAIEDFTRITDQMPDSKSAEQAAFMRGWCFYLLGKDSEALQVCEKFLRERPTSVFAPDVTFWLGEYAYNHGDPETAEKRFIQVATDFPNSVRAAETLFWAGRAAILRRNYLTANEHFNVLMERHPDFSRMAETLLAQGDVLSELGQFASAILAFNEVIVKFPQTPEALMAWGRKGDCQYTLGQDNSSRYEEALLSYRALLDFAGVPPDLRLQAGFKVGRSLEKMGRTMAALDRYMDVVYSYLQETSTPDEAHVWFTRAAFAAAALQENASRWAEAARIYGRVAASQAPAAPEARARMERIRQEHWLGEEKTPYPTSNPQHPTPK